MLYWTVSFIAIATIAAIYGYGGIAPTYASIAKILLYFMAALYIITVIMRITYRRQLRPRLF